MNEIITALDLNAIIVNVLLAVITGVIGFVGTWATAFLKSKLNANQLELLDTIAANVVLAVEQSTYGTELAENADAKKAMALEAISAYLKKYSINISADQLNTTIESAVANVLNANKLVEPPKVVEVEAGPASDGFANG